MKLAFPKEETIVYYVIKLQIKKIFFFNKTYKVISFSRILSWT